MSYDISLKDPVTSDVLELDKAHQMLGCTYVLDGTTEASLNVTCNYAKYFSVLGEKGIREIYGKTGTESIPMLESAISVLGDDVDEDYWKPTEGNVKRALVQLVALAKMRPYGIWAGD